MAPQAAIPGKSPTAAAGACAGGVAWKAWATITIPIQSTIAMPDSIGTKYAISAAAPDRPSTVKKAAFRTE
jgi:hypothetical protein